MIKKLLRATSGVLLSATLTCVPFLSSSLYAQQASVAQVAGKIVLSHNGKQTVISQSKDDGMPVTGKDEVFFVRKKGDAEKIAVYNIATGQITDIASTGTMAPDGNKLNGTIINMMYDKEHSKLYFSNKDKYPDSEQPLYLCWRYDMATHQLSLFKDGRIADMDKEKITVVLDDVDPDGAYTAKMYYSYTGTLLQRFEKEYK